MKESQIDVYHQDVKLMLRRKRTRLVNLKLKRRGRRNETP